jgi:hypothetical protein
LPWTARAPSRRDLSLRRANTSCWLKVQSFRTTPGRETVSCSHVRRLAMTGRRGRVPGRDGGQGRGRKARGSRAGSVAGRLPVVR